MGKDHEPDIDAYTHDAFFKLSTLNPQLQRFSEDRDKACSRSVDYVLKSREGLLKTKDFTFRVTDRNFQIFTNKQQELLQFLFDHERGIEIFELMGDAIPMQEGCVYDVSMDENQE